MRATIQFVSFLIFTGVIVTACAPATQTLQAITQEAGSPPLSQPSTAEAIQQTETLPLPVETVTAPKNCLPTQPDAEGPFYEPGAPLRERVGEGYVLQGVVRSAESCSPISAAQVEFWLAGPDGAYSDEFRATLFSDEDGAYRFESHPPPPYANRPPHIHIRVGAPGFQTLITQHYPEAGANAATFDLVLVKNP